MLRTDRTQPVKWTTEGMVKGSRRLSGSRDVRHTSVAADMMVSGESTLFYVNQGGTAGGEILPVLDRRLYQDSVMDGFFVRKNIL